MQKTAAMHDVGWCIAIPIVFSFHIVESLIRKMLHNAALCFSPPFKSSIGYRLIGIIDHDGVVRPGGAEEVSPLRRSAVNAGSRVRQNFRATNIHNERQSVSVSMT